MNFTSSVKDFVGKYSTITSQFQNINNHRTQIIRNYMTANQKTVLARSDVLSTRPVKSFKVRCLSVVSPTIPRNRCDSMAMGCRQVEPITKHVKLMQFASVLTEKRVIYLSSLSAVPNDIIADLDLIDRLFTSICHAHHRASRKARANQLTQPVWLNLRHLVEQERQDHSAVPARRLDLILDSLEQRIVLWLACLVPHDVLRCKVG